MQTSTMTFCIDLWPEHGWLLEKRPKIINNVNNYVTNMNSMHFKMIKCLLKFKILNNLSRKEKARYPIERSTSKIKDHIEVDGLAIIIIEIFRCHHNSSSPQNKIFVLGKFSGFILLIIEKDSVSQKMMHHIQKPTFPKNHLL